MGRSNGSNVVALAFWATLIMTLPEISGKRFTVGGNMGWTSDVNYNLWAKNQTFYLGDWLFFVYDRNQNDVIEVNKTNYETCNAEHPLHNYTTGSGRDVVELNVTHDRYFISSKGSCNDGMKFKVHLTPLPPPVNLAPLLSPVHLSPLSPPPVNLAPSPPLVNQAPIPQPPRAAPSTSRSHSSRYTLLGSQLVIPAVVTIAAIWDAHLEY